MSKDGPSRSKRRAGAKAKLTMKKKCSSSGGAKARSGRADSKEKKYRERKVRRRFVLPKFG